MSYLTDIHSPTSQSSMPRGPRLDYPGALHHVIGRGIERRKIFYRDRDRLALLQRLGDLVLSTGASLYAWSLMPNHLHALLRTGRLPLSRLVQRWLGPYATTFNLVHRRAGHLFQNRFKNTLVEEEPYLLELVRYIHLNPVKSRLPVTIDDLDHYPWTGHAVLLGNVDFPAQDTDLILGHFGNSVGEARQVYREFVRQGAAMEDLPDLEGGGLRRSSGGWELVERIGRGREKWAFDERILGTPEFVERVLNGAPNNEEVVPSTRALRPLDLDCLCRLVAERLSLTVDEIRSKSLRRCVLDARAIFSHVAVEHHALSLCATARYLRVSKQSIARALLRAPAVVAATGYSAADFFPE